MATVKYILQSKKPASQIYLRLSLGRNNSIKRKVGLTVDYIKWNSKNGVPINKDEQTKHLKVKLLKLQSFIEEQLNESNSKGEVIDGDWLSKQIDIHFKRYSNNNDLNIFNNLINYIIDSAATRTNAKQGVGLSKSRINGYKRLKDLVVEFQGNKNLRLKSIDLIFIQKFKNWLLEDMKYSESNTLKRIADIKTVCRNAEKLALEVNTQYRHIEIIRKSNSNIIFLTSEELNQIEKTKMPNDKLKNAKKWLLLGCELGQRGGDLLSINEKNISIYENKTNSSKFRVIKLTQQKTGKEVTIPLNPKSESLIKESLPYKISVQKLNDYVKEVCKLSKLNTITKGSLRCAETNRQKEGEYPKWQLVSTHICRRTFATNYFGKMNTSLLRTLTGHSTEKMLLNYIGRKENDFTEDAYLSMLQQQ